MESPNPTAGAPLEDRELVKKLLAKDEEAYRYFFETYRPKLYKACVHLLGYQDSDAEDITQEVLIAALRQLTEFEFRASFYHWLNRICMYLCYKRIRQRKRLITSEEAELEAVAPPVPFQHRDKEKEEGEKQKMLDLIQAQRELMGDPCKSLLDLREKENKSYAQIAQTLKVPIGTVMSRLARCKEALKNLVRRAIGEAGHG